MSESQVDLLHLAYGGFGGHQSVVNTLNSALTPLGIKTAVLGVTRSPDEQTNEGSWQSTRYFPIPSSHPVGGLSGRKFLKSLLSELNPRMILAHTHGLVSEVMAKSRHSGRAPFLVVREAHAIDLRSWKDNARSLLALQHASGVVFLSSEYRENFPLPLLSIKGRPVVAIIPNSVEQPMRHAANVSPTEGPTRIGMATRLVPGKRVKLLIDVAADLVRRGVEIELLIAGDGQERELLEDHASSQLLPESVHFLGSVAPEKMPDFYSSLSIYVHLSDGEGESNALLEAAAHGLPIVVSQSEGIPDFMSQSGGVSLVANQVERISEELFNLINLGGELALRGQTNAQLTLSERSVGATVNGYLEMFSVIDPQGPWSTARKNLETLSSSLSIERE